MSTATLNTAGTQSKSSWRKRTARFSSDGRPAAQRVPLRSLAGRNNRRKVDRLGRRQGRLRPRARHRHHGIINFNRYYFCKSANKLPSSTRATTTVVDRGLYYRHAQTATARIATFAGRRQFCSRARITTPRPWSNEMSAPAAAPLPWMFKRTRLGRSSERAPGASWSAFKLSAAVDGGLLLRGGDLWVAQRVRSGKSRDCAGLRVENDPRLSRLARSEQRRSSHAGGVEGPPGCDPAPPAYPSLRKVTGRDRGKLLMSWDSRRPRGGDVLFCFTSLCQNFLKSNNSARPRRTIVVAGVSSASGKRISSMTLPRSSSICREGK